MCLSFSSDQVQRSQIQGDLFGRQIAYGDVPLDLPFHVKEPEARKQALKEDQRLLRIRLNI